MMYRMMKQIFSAFLGLVVLSLPGLAAMPSPSEEQWEEAFASPNGQYIVKVEPKERTVEVKRVEEGPGAPPYLRLRIQRENQRPLEVRLKTIEVPGSSVRYTGRLDQWNQSYMGMEVEFSFDRKTWTKLARKIKEALP